MSAPAPLSEADQMHAFILARISMIETVVMLMLQDHPNREEIKRSALFKLEADEVVALNRPGSDEEKEIAQMGGKQSFEAIFHALRKSTGNID